MPMSLWLIPREGNPFTKAVEEWINDEVPKLFLPPEKMQKFFPHVTLVSDIDIDQVAKGKSPQEWLDSLKLPEFKAEISEVILNLDTIEAEDDFYRKMNIAVQDGGNLKKLAACVRSQAASESEDKAEEWAQKEYQPHLSLLYADVPTKDVKGRVALVEMKVQFSIGDIFACCGGTLCMGGHMVLVDTSQPVEKWDTSVRRETPWVMWRATKNLI